MRNRSFDLTSLLGNHDFILMSPDLKAMEIQFLINEHTAITCDDEIAWLINIDDPHYFRADNIEKTCNEIPINETSI